jgi:hypothetical protein
MKTIVFAGPTLPAKEVKALLPCEVWPPAAQGDVWRALREQPRMLVLIDGVFESRPSVWHRELLDALDSGVIVLGAASMGALRAAELAPFGMVGVGEIFRSYRDGVLIDDSEVALLHADAEHDHRALTLPLVNVRHAAVLAARRRVLSATEAAQLIQVAERIFYQERHWPRVRAELDAHWSVKTRAKWDRFAARGVEDLKAKDARECLRTARKLLSSRPPHDVRLRATPSHVRRRKLENSEVTPEAVQENLRTLALASWARSLGIRASAQEIQHELQTHAKLASTIRIDRYRWAETRVLERHTLAWSARLGSDGPSWIEGANSSIRRTSVPKNRPQIPFGKGLQSGSEDSNGPWMSATQVRKRS